MTVLAVSLLTTLSYLYVVLHQTRQLFFAHTAHNQSYWLGSALAIGGHSLILYGIVETPHGQNLVWPVILSCIFWLMSIVNLLCSIEPSSKRLALLIYPFSALSIALVLIWPNKYIVDTAEDPNMLSHIFVSIAAVSFLFISGIWAMLIAWQNYLLKTRSHAKPLLVLPPIQTMENNLFRIIAIGLTLLTCSLVTGFIFEPQWMNQLTRSKTILTLTAWTLFTVLLVGRRCFGWRGLRAAKCTIIGVTLITLSYFGTKTILL